VAAGGFRKRPSFSFGGTMNEPEQEEVKYYCVRCNYQLRAWERDEYRNLCQLCADGDDRDPYER